MWLYKLITHSLNDTWQEVIHSLIDEFDLIVILHS